MDTKIYDIENLDLHQHTTNVVVSKRESGKTKLVLNLIKYYIDKFDYNYIYLFFWKSWHKWWLVIYW